MNATGMEDGPDPVGDSLRDRLRACRMEGVPGLPVSDLLRYVSAVASELDTRGQPHGNVNPDTIRVVSGLARLTDDPTDGQLPALRPGALIGTPAYMAPEAWEGKLTASGDQYALACTYAELRLGRLPFPGSDLAMMMRAHRGQLPDLEGCTDAEQRVLVRALAKAADQRFPSCRHLAEQLTRAIASGA